MACVAELKRAEADWNWFWYPWNCHFNIWISPSGGADFFRGSPLPKLIILKSPFEPGKKKVQNISKLFSFGVQMPLNRKIIFMGGEFTRTYMYVKPQGKNDPWLFEGVWFFKWLSKVGNQDLNLWKWCYNDYDIMHVFARGGGNLDLFWCKYERVVQRGWQVCFVS